MINSQVDVMLSNENRCNIQEHKCNAKVNVIGSAQMEESKLCQLSKNKSWVQIPTVKTNHR